MDSMGDLNNGGEQVVYQGEIATWNDYAEWDNSKRNVVVVVR